MLDDFREWLSDNLRYILLGLGVILVLVIVVCIVRLLGGNSGTADSSSQNASNQTKVSTEAASESSSAGTGAAQTAGTAETAAAGTTDLVKNDAAILTLVQSYYSAVADKDTAKLSSLVIPWNDEVENKILSNNVIESYENIATYSKKGLNDGEYVVYAYYDGKLADIDTLVPSLAMLYLTAGDDGALVVYSERETNQAIYDYTEQAKTEADVQALITQVNEQYQAALSSDEKLSSYIASHPSGTENVDEASTDTGGDAAGGSGDAQVGAVMTSTVDLNIRQTASTDAAIMAVVPTGGEVTIMALADDGWVQVSYVSDAGTVEGYVKLEYLSASGTDSSGTGTADASSSETDAASAGGTGSTSAV